MERIREYLKNRNIPEDSLEANSILEGYEKGYQDATNDFSEWLDERLRNAGNRADYVGGNTGVLR
jgi:hypothetical protein